MARAKWKRKVPRNTPGDLRQHIGTCYNENCVCKSSGHQIAKLQEACSLVTDSVLDLLGDAEASVLEQAQTMLGESWLVYEIDGPTMAMGCKVCMSEKGFQFTTKDSCTLHRLNRHASGPEHQRNVCKFLGFVVPKPALEVQWPGKEAFLKVFRQLSNDTSDRHVPGVSAERKTANIEWCIVEAARHIWRERLRQASFVSVLRDERHKRVLIRFRCVDKDLNLTHGLFGQLKDTYSSTAFGLVQATLQVIRDMCTPGLGLPGSARENLTCDEDLVQHVRRSVLSTTVDSAGNEVAAVFDSAAPILASSLLLENGDTLFPCHKLLVRDRAHGTRRILERPWRADDYLDTIVTSLVTGRSSITQLIQHSFDFKQWYAEATGASKSKAVSTSFKTLRAALHRYESLVTPLSCFVLDLEAILSVAMRIARERSGEQAGRSAASFLAAVEPEMLLTAAMLADAGDEGLQLIRWFDQDDCKSDSAMVNSRVKQFLESVRLLFVEEQVLKLRGHTHVMLRWLSTSHVLAWGSEVKSLGGPMACPPALQQRCLQRLKAWVALAEKVLAAEFPEFEAVAAMRVFDVSESCTELDSLGADDLRNIPQHVAADLTRIAQTFDSDPVCLQMEWLDFRPRARWHAQQARCTNVVAWQKALKEVQNRRQTAERHPCQHLREMLAVYASICISDSVLERSFSQAASKIPAEARHVRSHTESIRMSLLALSESDILENVDLMKAIWTKYLPSSRSGAFDRIDRGRRQFSKREAPHTQGAFLKARREEVVQAKAGRADLVTQPIMLEDGVWTEGHKKEQEFNDKKRKKRKIEALIAGSLLESEIDIGLLAESLAFQRTTEANRRQRHQREQRSVLDLSAGRVPTHCDMTDLRVHVADGRRSALMDARAIQLRWTWAVDPCTADLFLTDMSGFASQVPVVEMWVAALRGLWVIDASWAECEYHDFQGAALKFVSALSTRRFIWISGDLTREHGPLCRVLTSCARGPDSKWTVVDDIEIWVQKKEELTNKRMAATAVAAVTPEEVEQYQGVPHVFQLADFFQFACRLDRQSSRLNLSGM